jgi:polygalacturonase
MNIHQITRNSVLLVIFVLSLSSMSSLAQTGKDIKSMLSGLPFQMPDITLPSFPDKSVNILDFGAVGDGQTLNTAAFSKAIETCNANGGGTVIVPAGLWLTGPIQLLSNMNLHLEKGALVIFSRDHKDYPIILNPVNKTYAVSSPIFGFNLENIAITGDGIIDGSGDTWRPVKKAKTTEAQWKKLLASGGVVSTDNTMYWPTQEAMDGEQYLKDLKKQNIKPSLKDLEKARDFLRPYMILLVKCKKVLLDGPTFQNSPKFVLYPNYCEDMVIRNIKVLNEWWAQNGDAIDISGGKNIVVYNCLINAGDDGICMKSSKTKNYDQDPVLQNVAIFDCTVYHAHGGFVIGSNTDGGMRNIYVNNCNFISTDVGLRFKSNRGKGGLIENIFVNNIFMKDIANQAILFDTFYESTEDAEGQSFQVTEKTPRFQKFYINNIFCNGAGQAAEITGLPEMPIQDIEFKNVAISSKKGFSAMETQNIRMNNVSIIPAKGPVFTFENSRDFLLKKLACPTGTSLFIKLNGKTTTNIQLLDTDITKANKGIELGPDVEKGALIVK